MGKCSKHKKFRKIAEGLPEVKVWSANLFTVEGDKLIEEGVKETKDGQPILAGKTYRRRQPVPINHERMLKKAYEENGNKGVTDYVAAAIQTATAQKEQAAKSEVLPDGQGEEESK